jgi:hypothetical protein
MALTKKVTLSTILASILIVCCSLNIDNGVGAPTGKTGSPGDGSNCGGCHSGTAVTSIANAITSTIPATGYIPGTVYTISATISDPAKNKFGFEISPQRNNGTAVGTLGVTDAGRTQLIGSGKYITHKSTGTAGTSNATTWTFNWTAPVAGSGNFTFYGAFLLANANSSTSGDVVKLSTLAITEDLTTGIAQNNFSAIKFYPNPATDYLYSDIENNNGATLSIYSLSGEKVNNIAYENHEKIKADVSLLADGVYIAELKIDGKTITKKFIKK